jgi:hypothetical protein
MTTVIGVYREAEELEAVARDLVAHGVPEADIRIGADEDHYQSISAEMEAEVSDSWGSAGLGTFLTAEMMRGAVVFIVIGAAVGIVIGIPIGLLLYSHTSSMVTRLGVGALIGVLFGGTVGAILGGGLAMQSPEEGLAAESGLTVRVEHDSPEIEAAMTSHDPVRLDVFSGQRRLRTPSTEGPSGIAETFDQFQQNIADPHRQG